MPSIAPLPRFRFFTRGSLGTPVRPLVGGRVYFYEAGTTTPKDTFTDSTGLVKNTNPVVLDARGEADIWLGDGLYKMQVTDALGVNQGGPVDGIKGNDQLEKELSLQLADYKSDIAASGGAGLIGYIQAGLGAVAQLLRDKLQRDLPVTPFDFGGVGDGSADDTTPLLRAAARAVNAKRPLDLRGGVWRITGTTTHDWTEIRTILCDYRSYILDDRSGGGYAVTFGNPASAWNEDRANGVTISGQLSLLSSGRAVAKDGVYFKGSWPSIDSIHADNYNGMGIRMDSAHDGCIGRLRTERCGNQSLYALTVNSAGDTTNSIDIASVQCEQSFHKGLNLDLIRARVGNIHCERTYILTTDDGANGLPNGGQYLNHRFVLGNSEVRQAYLDAVPSGTVIPDSGGATTPTNKLNVLAFMDESAASTIKMNASDFMLIGGEGGEVSTLSCLNFYQRGPANNTVVRGLQCTLCSAEGAITFEAPRSIGTFTPAFNGVLQKVFGGNVGTVNFTNNVLGDISFIGTKIASVQDTRSNSAGREVTSFTDCEIDSFTGSFNGRARVTGGYINDCNLASQAAVEFSAVWFGSFNHNGNTAYLTNGCRAGTVTNWALPLNVNYPAGTRTERLNYVAGAGDRYVNKDGANTWAAITNLPA